MDYSKIYSQTIGKPQVVRLFDVFFLGPIMMYSAAKNKLPRPLKAVLFVSGVLTVTYNLKNFINQVEINKKFGRGPLDNLTESNAAETFEKGPLPLKGKFL
jgi:hypothetical protein